MNAVGTAVLLETRKILASRIPWVVAVMLCAGIALLTGGMLLGAASGDPQIVAKLGPLASAGGWTAIVGTAAQILAAGGLMAQVILLSWVFGREFADGTIGGLFAAAVPRPAIVLAKLIVFLAWSAIVGVVLTLGVLAVGVFAGAAVEDPGGVGQVLRLPALALLSALVATPAALAATVWRGLLPGIAVGAVILVVAQVCAVIGIGTWVPFVAPALWAIDPAAVPAGALWLVASVPLAFGAAVAWSWSRLQLDR